jgi:hypothetical protein
MEALASAGPALPFRFHTVVVDFSDLIALVREREADWQDRLEVVTGHVEVLVHVRDEARPPNMPESTRPTMPTSESGPATAGGDYLRSRAERLRRVEQLMDGLISSLRPPCREFRVLRPREGMRLACLVPSQEVDSLRGALARWTATSQALATSITGPWPPFSFADQEGTR